MRRAHAAGRFFAASLPTQPKSFDMGAFRPASDAPSSYWSATTKEKRYGIRSKYADGILFLNNRMQGTRPTAVAASRSTASSTIWPIAGGANTTRGLRSGGIARPSFEVPGGSRNVREDLNIAIIRRGYRRPTQTPRGRCGAAVGHGGPILAGVSIRASGPGALLLPEIAAA